MTAPTGLLPVHAMESGAARLIDPQFAVGHDGEVSPMLPGAVTVWPENAGTTPPAAAAVRVSPPSQRRLVVLKLLYAPPSWVSVMVPAFVPLMVTGPALSCSGSGGVPPSSRQSETT